MAGVTETRVSFLSAGSLSPEFPLDHAVPDFHSGTIQPRVATAANGTSLVAWVDTFLDVTTVYAVRVDPTGNPLGASATVIDRSGAEATGVSAQPLAVGTDGTDFLVAWLGPEGLVASRVLEVDGSVVDGPGNRILLASSSSQNPAIAFDQGNWLVIWAVPSVSDNTLAGALIAGTTVTPIAALSAVTDLGSSERDASPGLTTGAGSFCVTLANLAMRIRSADGQPLDATPVQFANRVKGVHARPAFDGTNFYVVWTPTSSRYANALIYGARVRASDGVLLDPDDDFNDLPGSLPLAPDGIGPNVDYLDGNFVVTATTITGSNLFAVTASPATGQRTGGTATSPGTTLVSNVYQGLYATTLTAAASLAFVGGSAYPITHATGVLSGGTAATPYTLVGGFATIPALAFNGTNWLSVYVAEEPSLGIYARRIAGTDHSIVDVQPLQVGPTSPSYRSVAVASNGTDFLVAWLDGDGVHARGVGADGSLGQLMKLNPQAVSIGITARVAVAYDGARYLVAWSDAWLYGVRLDGLTLSPLDQSPIIIGVGPIGAVVAVADKAPDLDHETFLLAYDDTKQTVRAARLRGMLGTAVDGSMPLLVGQGLGPRIAYDGQNALVAWTGVSGGVQGRRIFPLDGTFVDAQPVTLVSTSPNAVDHDIALAFDAKAYVLADVDLLTTANAVHVARFSPSLAALDPPARLLVSDVAPDNAAVALGVRSNSEVIVAYPVFVPATGEAGEAIHARAFVDDWDGVTVPPADAGAGGGSAGGAAGAAGGAGGAGGSKGAAGSGLAGSGGQGGVGASGAGAVGGTGDVGGDNGAAGSGVAGSGGRGGSGANGAGGVGGMGGVAGGRGAVAGTSGNGGVGGAGDTGGAMAGRNGSLGGTTGGTTGSGATGGVKNQSPDAGPMAGGGTSSGCGCHTTGDAPESAPAALALLLALSIIRRRRSRPWPWR